MSSLQEPESIDDSEFEAGDSPSNRKLMKLNHYTVVGDIKETASPSSRNAKSEKVSSFASHKRNDS